jgi:ribosome biogenesis GTPase
MKSTHTYRVQSGSERLDCTLSARAGKQSPGELPTVGDEVLLSLSAPGCGQIIERLPRRNQLARRSAVPMPSAQAHEQVIAANVDQVMPVFAVAQPDPSWHLLDRTLVSAESAGIPALVCITKLDLLEPGPGAAQLEAAVDDYRRIGYPVIETSYQSEPGLDKLRYALHGRLTVLVGKSGVGKTSLLNALQPGLGLWVREVSRASGRGRHTTAHLEMFPLDGGGAIIDTPGIREFGLWDVAEDDLALFFPEMRPYIGKCKFGLGCHHDEEPGCAIRRAVNTGLISPYRYQSYLRLKENP